MVKTPLNNSTSLSNSAGLAPPDEKLILAAAEKAFADNATSATLSGSATQRLAYAIMCEYTTMIDKGVKLAPLGQCIPGSEAAKELVKAMTMFFIGKAPKLAANAPDDKVSATKKPRSARVALLGRSCKFAATLAKHNVGFASFNDKAGAFIIPCAMLVNVDKGESLRGRLAANPTVLLDNTPASIERPDAQDNPKLVPIQTSVSQVMVACNPPASRERDRTDEGVEDLVKELRDILCDEDHDGPIHKSAYPDATWNYLGELAAWYNETISNPAFNAPLKIANKAA